MGSRISAKRRSAFGADRIRTTTHVATLGHARCRRWREADRASGVAFLSTMCGVGGRTGKCKRRCSRHYDLKNVVPLEVSAIRGQQEREIGGPNVNSLVFQSEHSRELKSAAMWLAFVGPRILKRPDVAILGFERQARAQHSGHRGRNKAAIRTCLGQQSGPCSRPLDSL